MNLIIAPHQTLSPLQAFEACKNKQQAQLSDEAYYSLKASYQYLQNKLQQNQQAIYGINTGFGIMCNTIINPTDLKELQKNLLLSHACGTGNEVPQPIVKLMLLLKIQSLCYGHSGVQIATVQRLIDFYNHDILPEIFEQGSLGASGDLAPLSHLSLPIIGLGKVWYKGIKQNAQQVLYQLNWQPIELQAKEGLALINGTQFMSSYAVWCLQWAKYLANAADLIAAISFDAFDARYDALNPLIHEIRNQKGQKKSAKNILNYLQNSEIGEVAKKQVQDPYSFRCAPQVHGASRNAINHVNNIVKHEINAVTDNPLIFAKEDLILSGGNFHGQPLALALDYLAIALAELGSISERRTFWMLAGSRQLPPMLIKNAGLNSGLMIPQYTAAALVSQNKQLCTPASIDSIPSSNNQEDHVSMGANAATKCYRVVKNLQNILAIELLTACQALSLRKQIINLNTSPHLESLLEDYRKQVPFLSSDRYLHDDIIQSSLYIEEKLSSFIIK